MEGEEPKSPSLPEDSPLNEYSERVAKNVVEFQQFIDEVSEVLEQDEIFSEMTAESHEKKKSCIRSHLSQLLSVHNLLADQFGDLIQEVSKKCPSMTQNPHPGFITATGFDLHLKTDGGGFYLSKGSSHFGSESSKSSGKKPSVLPVNEDAKDTEALLEKIYHLEEEVVSLKQKLESLIVENGELKIEIEENIADVDLYMSESIKDYKTMEDGFNRSREIVKNLDKHMSDVVVDKFAIESKHKSEMKEMNMKMTEYMTEIAQLKATHEKKEKIWNGVTGQLKQEVKEKSELVDQVSEHMNILCADKSSQNMLIHQLKTELSSVKSELNSLKFENSGVLLSFENVLKLTDELKLKVAELEREVERQGQAMLNRE